ERNRAVYVIKSRGMNHSKEVREFVITSKGLDLIDVFRSKEGVLVGTARKERQKEDATRAKQDGMDLIKTKRN
ncbi:MAG TPA: hypothetical protein VN763_04320, partial [Saprospiraceae bacterium]|nr:hypothetical protein [Saprospiraceae bacterium]